MKSKLTETPADFGRMTHPAYADPDCRRQMIEQAAYFRSESKGFPDGCALSDWLDAEAEIDKCHPVSKSIN